MRLRVLRRRVVEVVRRHRPDPEIASERDLAGGHDPLLPEPVILELDPVVPGAEDVAVLGGDVARLASWPASSSFDSSDDRQPERQVTPSACSPAAACPSGAVVEALEVGGRHELQEVR